MFSNPDREEKFGHKSIIYDRGKYTRHRKNTHDIGKIEGRKEKWYSL